MKQLLFLLALLAGPMFGMQATLCQSKGSPLHRTEYWHVEGSPDFSPLFADADFGKAAPGRGCTCDYRAIFFVSRGEQRMIVRMYEPEHSYGLFNIIPVTGVLGDGRILVDDEAGRDASLPELYDRLMEAALPRGYACYDTDAATHAEQEFYQEAVLSPQAEATLAQNLELRNRLSKVEEAELIHRDRYWSVSYIDLEAGHLLLVLEGHEDVRSLQLSHYAYELHPNGDVSLRYIASCRFSYSFADIGRPTFSADYRSFLLPLSDEEMGVRTTLCLPAWPIGGVSEYTTGYRDGMGPDSSPADALLHELVLGRYGNAVLMLRGGKVDMDSPNADGMRPRDYMPDKLRAALQEEAAAKRP